MAELTLVDVGSKVGSAADHVLALHRQGYIQPKECLCIDAKDYGDSVRAKGYQFMKDDVTLPDFQWPDAEIYTAFHFLEHLPSVAHSNRAVLSMLDHARSCVWLRMPRFEPDPVMLSHRIRFSWDRWAGHTSRYTLSDLLNQVLLRPEWKIRSCKGLKFVTSSDHHEVVPFDAPKDSVAYHPSMGAKPSIWFNPPIAGEWEIVLNRV